MHFFRSFSCLYLTVCSIDLYFHVFAIKKIVHVLSREKEKQQMISSVRDGCAIHRLDFRFLI